MMMMMMMMMTIYNAVDEAGYITDDDNDLSFVFLLIWDFT